MHSYKGFSIPSLKCFKKHVHFIMIGPISLQRLTFASQIHTSARRPARLIVFALQQNGRMRNIGNILAHHKKLVIESRLPQQPLKSTPKNQQKQAKSRSSEFNIHRPISKGKIDPQQKLQHRQSQSVQNYQKLKLQFDVDKQKSKNRLSLQYSLFEPMKNGMDNKQNPVVANFEQLIQKILTLMQEHSDLAPTEEEKLVISRTRLKEVIVEILLDFVQNHMKLRPPRCNCRELNALLRKLAEEAERELRSRATHRLDIDQGVLTYTWGTDQLKLQQEKAKGKLSYLSWECNKLEQRISELTAYHSSLQEECKIILQDLQEQKKQSQAVNARITQGNKTIKSLTTNIQELQQRLAAISTQQSSMKNYAAEQHTQQLLRIISQDYHRIQSAIHEYAVYLQSNQIANDLLSEPKLFNQIQEQMNEQEKELSAALSRSRESRKEQVERVRTFLEDAMQLFRRKDHQLMRLLQIRTKCVRQFVEHMKKWLSNWEIRQEFLGNLRKEFATDAALLISMTEKAVARGDIGAEDMKQAAQRLIENYKMGNSFY